MRLHPTSRLIALAIGAGAAAFINGCGGAQATAPSSSVSAAAQANMPPATIVMITGAKQFDEAMRQHATGGKVVVVDFHASWCPPCRVLGPILERLAAEHSDRMVLVQIDVDAEKNDELVTRFEVNPLPALFTFRDGKMTGKSVGGMDLDEAKKFIGL